MSNLTMLPRAVMSSIERRSSMAEINGCKDRISKLEALLVESAREKDELRKMVLELTREVASLRTKVEFFESSNRPRTSL